MYKRQGELNLTVFIVMVVAALGVFFFTVLWPAIRNNMASTTRCSDAICESEPNGDGTVNCFYQDKNGNHISDFTCVWKG